MRHKTFISPREFGEAIGVSPSSMKRWVDDGRIKAPKTAGGHRRIAIEEAIRFVRESGLPILDPSILGLDELNLSAVDSGADDEAVYRALESGDGEAFRGILLAKYLGGTSLASLFDGAVAHALARLGDLWHDRGDGIATEHRATDLCIQAVNQLRLLVAEPSPKAPRAIGGAISGDAYLLPSLMAAAVLQSLGFSTTNLGPETPLPTLIDAARADRAKLVWLSINHHADPASLESELVAAAREILSFGAVLVVGGRRTGLFRLPELVRVATMSELEAFARGRRADLNR